MADFCKQCSIKIFGEDFEDFTDLCKSGETVRVLCEGCGSIEVDHAGLKVAPKEPPPKPTEEVALENLIRKILHQNGNGITLSVFVSELAGYIYLYDINWPGFADYCRSNFNPSSLREWTDKYGYKYIQYDTGCDYSKYFIYKD